MFKFINASEGERCILQMTCPKCGYHVDEVYYAPTCGFVDWECPNCQHIVDLEEYTGISYEDASNADLIKNIIESYG